MTECFSSFPIIRNISATEQETLLLRRWRARLQPAFTSCANWTSRCNMVVYSISAKHFFVKFAAFWQSVSQRNIIIYIKNAKNLSASIMRARPTKKSMLCDCSVHMCFNLLARLPSVPFTLHEKKKRRPNIFHFLTEIQTQVADKSRTFVGIIPLKATLNHIRKLRFATPHVESSSLS